MPADARQLAAALRAADDDSLRALFAARQVSAAVGWHDLFDAADALLEPQAVQLALSRLPRTTATALADVVAASHPARSPHIAQLAALALTTPDGEPYATVATAVAAVGAPRTDQRAVPDPVDSPAAAERALTTVAAVADLLLLSYAQPAQQVANGALTANERRRLVELDVIGDSDEADALFAIAAAAGLVRTVSREWLVTADASDWLNAATPDRWRALVRGFGAGVPDALSHGGAGELTDAHAWADAYPWDPQWPQRAAHLCARARLLGLVTADGAPTAWQRADDAGIAALVAHLPREVDRVYLQNDLSAIAPGPLAPALDIRLRSVADRESHAQASTYRFSDTSVHRALAGGETAATLRTFLTELSLTGLPQPLDYLIGETARRHGDLVVGVDSSTGRTRITTATPALRDTLRVDQALRPLGLVPDGDALTTRVGRDAVALTLANGRYPVAVVDEHGRPDPLQRGRIAPEAPSVADQPDYDQLIATLRSVSAADEDAAWLTRSLEEAVRQRAVLEVTVALPDGTRRTLLLEAAGLGGGRLRGRDRAADVERTLPVSHITDVRVVG